MFLPPSSNQFPIVSLPPVQIGPHRKDMLVKSIYILRDFGHVSNGSNFQVTTTGFLKVYNPPRDLEFRANLGRACRLVGLLTYYSPMTPTGQFLLIY